PVAAAALAGKMLNVGLAAVGAGLIGWHATRRELLGPDAPRWLAAAVVAAASLAIPVLTVLTALLSEPLFGLLLAGAIVCADDLPAESGAPSRRAVLAGVGAAAALLARSIGVAAGVGIVVFLMVVRRVEAKTALLTALPVVLATLAWGWWTLSHRTGIDPAIAAGYGTYGDVIRQAGLSALATRSLDLPRPLAVLTLGWVPSVPVYYLLAVLAPDADPLVSLYTGRRTVPLYVYAYRGAGDAVFPPSEQLAFFQRAGVTHVLLGGPGESAAQLDALLGAVPGRLKLVHRWPGQ